MARVYQAFYRLPISINLLRFLCGYTSHKLLARPECTIVNSKNEAKSLFRGHCLLCTTRRFIGALVLSTFGPRVVQA